MVTVSVDVGNYWGEPQASPTVTCWLGFLSRYIYIYRPADLCLWSGARRQGRMLRGPNLRVVTLCENDLLLVHMYAYMFLHIRLRIRHWSNLLEFSFCVWLSALNHSAKNIRTSELNAIKSKKPGLSFASGPAGIETCSFVFRFSCPSWKPIRQNNAIIATHCGVSFFRSYFITQRRKVFFFFDRQLSYSCLSHSSSVLAANDCTVSSTFSFFLIGKRKPGAGSNTITSPGMPANVRTSLTNTYNLSELVRQSNSCVGWCIHAKKNRTTTLLVNWLCCFRSFFIKTRAGEFSRSLRQPQQSPRLAPQCLAFP